MTNLLLGTMTMAMVHNLPPQAYTRDVLVKAIDWVSTQPSSVRERAASADALVSLYLQARRRPDWHQEAPVSGEAFRSDLQHLAHDLRQDEPIAVPKQTAPSASLKPVEPIDQGQMTEPLFRAAQQYTQQKHAESCSASASRTPEPILFEQKDFSRETPDDRTSEAKSEPSFAPPSRPAPQPTMTIKKNASNANLPILDSRTMSAAKEIQSRLNLSSESEAIRFLVTLGLERARQLFP
jgi:hypothetical protein